MKISVYQCDLPLKEGRYSWSEGKSVEVFDSTVVEVETECGIAMTLEDSWGEDIVTAAIAHLAQGAPSELQFTSTDFNSYVTTSIADGAPQRVKGRMSASAMPGLGVSPRFEVFGDPVWRSDKAKQA